MTTRSPWSSLCVVASMAMSLCACASESESAEGGTGDATAGGTGGTSAAATGGTWTGGTPTGGATGGWIGSTGGVATVPNTGGVSTGGLPATGGVATGGAPTGGLPGTGGVAIGGAEQGGTGEVSTGGGGASGAATGGAAETGGEAATGGAGSELPPTDDYSAPGPFETTTDTNVGPDGQCVIFRPATLGEDGFLHAPIVFGPGIGMQAMQMQGLLLSFASHGFVVIGTGVLNGGPNDPANLAAMENALDWIIQQNSESGIYQGVLDVDRAISMGYSVGGTAAVELGGHEAVATTVSIHGHTVRNPPQHGPMLQTSGTLDTVGLPMQQATYDASPVQTFLGTVDGADHGYIQADNGGVERPAIIAWMRYWIYNDTGATDYFWGDECVLCTAPWTNPQRKNWQ